MVCLGIDGGGTKTAFLLIDEKGNILSKYRTGTCNYIQIGKEKFGEVIGEGAAACCEKAGLQKADIACACIGIPSFEEIAEDTPVLKEIAKRALGGGRVECVNDVVVAWAGSLACEPGIDLLAGTGSMGYGVDPEGRAARSGGWGYFCGDEGSGYWLGKKLIELFSKQADGRMERSKTYEIVRGEFGLASDFDLIPLLYHKMNLRRDEIAGLQLLLEKAARAGDPHAADCYRLAAHELALIVRAIIRRLHFHPEEPVTVSYSGGLFKAGDLIFDPLRKELNECRARLAEPELSPVAGAALYAFEQCAGKSRGMLENLRRQDKGR